MAAKKNPMKVLAVLVHNETDNELPMTFYSMEGIPYRKRVTLKPKYQGLITSLVLFKIEFEDHNPFVVDKWLEIFILPDPKDEFSLLIKGGAIAAEIRESVLDYVMISNYLRLLHLDTSVLDMSNKPKTSSTNVITKQPGAIMGNYSLETLNAPSFYNFQFNNQGDGDRQDMKDVDYESDLEEVMSHTDLTTSLKMSVKNNAAKLKVPNSPDQKEKSKGASTIGDDAKQKLQDVNFNNTNVNSSQSTKKMKKNESDETFMDAVSKANYTERYTKNKSIQTKPTKITLNESSSLIKWADEEVRKAYDYMKYELTRRPYKNAIKRVVHHKFRHAYETLIDEQKRYIFKRFIYSSWKRIKCTKFFCCTDKKCSRQFHGLFFFIMIINIIAQIYFFAEASKKRIYNFTWRAIFESTAVLFASINDFLLSSVTDWPLEEKIMCCVYPDCNCFSLSPPTFIPFLFMSLLSDLVCGTGMSLITVDLYDVLDNQYRLPLILVDAICSTLMITLIGVINDIKKKIIAEALVGRLYPSVSLCIAVFRNLTETMVSVVAFGAFGGTICGIIKSKINLDETGLDEFFFYYFQLSNASLKIVKMFASAIRGLCRQLGHVIKRTMETRFERELPSFTQIKLRKRVIIAEDITVAPRLASKVFTESTLKKPVIINIAGSGYSSRVGSNATSSNSSEVDSQSSDLLDEDDWMFYSENEDDETVKNVNNKNTSVDKNGDKPVVDGSKIFLPAKDDFNFITFDNKSGFFTVAILNGEGLKRPRVLEDLESYTVPNDITNVRIRFRTWRIIPYCVPYFCKCPCNLNRAICNGCLGCCFRLEMTNVICDWPYHLCWKTLPAWNRKIDYGPACARCMKRFNIFCCIYPGKDYEIKHNDQRVYVLHTLCTKRSLIEERDLFEEVIVV